MTEFELRDREFIPLCDLLKVMNLCSTGGHAKIVIADGEVTVDGEVELRKRCKVRKGQRVIFENKVIQVI